MIVFERTGGLGDVLCCLGAYHALKKKYPGHLIVFATAKSLACLLRYCDEIDAVYGIPLGASIPKEKAGWLVDRCYEPHTSDERQQGGQKLHLSHAFLKDCDLPYINWQPRISIPTHIKETVARRFNFHPDEPIIALHSGRTWPVRELPEECWQQIVIELKKQFQGRIIHFCTPARTSENSQPVFQLTGTQFMPEALDIVATAAILSQCRLLVGIDSGLLHLAGALSIPVVGVFGAVNPQYRLPFGTSARGVYASLPCSFCHHENPIRHWLKGCPYDICCMKEITALQVVKTVEDILRNEF